MLIEDSPKVQTDNSPDLALKIAYQPLIGLRFLFNDHLVSRTAMQFRFLLFPTISTPASYADYSQSGYVLLTVEPPCIDRLYRSNRSTILTVIKEHTNRYLLFLDHAVLPTRSWDHVPDCLSLPDLLEEPIRVLWQNLTVLCYTLFYWVGKWFQKFYRRRVYLSLFQTPLPDVF